MRPNTRVQRTRSSPSAFRSPLTRRPLGRGRSSWALGLAPALAIASLSMLGLTQASQSDPFAGVIVVDRNVTPSGGAVQFQWAPLALSQKEAESLRGILRSALARELKEEAEARKSGQVSGGVPGCMSPDFRVTFRQNSKTWSGILHLSCDWLEIKHGPGIAFSKQEEAALQSLLKMAGP